MTPDQVDASKQHHPTCATCTSHGIHRYSEFQGHPQLRIIYDYLVANNLKSEGVPPAPMRPTLISLGLIQDGSHRQSKSA